MANPCIERRFLGGTEHINFGEFAQFVIQDEDEAIVIAERMLENPGDEYPFNEDAGPEHYEEFFVTNETELRRQLGQGGIE